MGRFQYHVIGGATGSGKGKLLDALRAHGAQVALLTSSLPASGRLRLISSSPCAILKRVCPGAYACVSLSASQCDVTLNHSHRQTAEPRSRSMSPATMHHLSSTRSTCNLGLCTACALKHVQITSAHCMQARKLTIHLPLSDNVICVLECAEHRSSQAFRQAKAAANRRSGRRWWTWRWRPTIGAAFWGIIQPGCSRLKRCLSLSCCTRCGTSRWNGLSLLSRSPL